MLWLYNIGISFYGLIVSAFSIFNSKAKLFSQGRKNIFDHIEKALDGTKKHIWFHFASLGEFEQGRPLLEKIKELHPQKRIVITFFSPSGYEIRKNYALASGVFYLPLDTAGNAKRFISLINPEMAIFTKYEFWYHYFKTLNDQQIPLYLISGIFRPNQIFFRWYGSFHRRILGFVDHFFVQNTESVNLLKQLQLENVSLSGDTRFDRVAENALSPKKVTLVENGWINNPVFIAGSTWPADERLIAVLIQQQPDWQFIIAPHEIDEAHIHDIEKLIPGAVRYSNLDNGTASRPQTLIIDNIGLLSSLYQYASISYIGGGFGVGIHNTLEAAAFGTPVIFGPKYDKFQEAKDLIALTAARSIETESDLSAAFTHFRENKEAGKIAQKYVNEKTGSTRQILEFIEKQF
ncbi:3-deoxy-D-manno-octulosonic-acid transferase [Pedobacter steynii]|uniref:3-deoxy-D-manno-octulosonic acid transferase n=1 Tax=Pedobacter steynii TaxID=430522 RepID=A0A1G9XGV5_9SPHI|nr:glycosyltransferase N-terminal domain-containing protein [Pedobacter steynii]NQX40579.1 3-deoxy-D-manno-octulosonic acid transferase [Pedobacter steynii]SDM95533.1 3-deoxy-D-manno-octulosonic-acid transferase [Pedobacter steynii]